MEAFEPTVAAAQARIARVDPEAYARTRGRLDGAVSGLSPYLTHGFVSLRQVRDGVARRHPLPANHRFVFELGWRAYFRHVWSHRGTGILTSLRPGPLPEAAYAHVLPDDLRQARTGVPVVDEAVRTLVRTGWLHNAARLWLASYVVHVRKVHWRTGADWMIGHLLDGDLGSNHLSWQWVAGTASAKPYVFTAEGVARQAPAAWHSAGTVVDVPRDEALRRAHSGGAAAPTRVHTGPIVETEPALYPHPVGPRVPVAPDLEQVRDRDVWLVHPWNLGDPPDDGTTPMAEAASAGVGRVHPDARGRPLVLAVTEAGFHRAWPWSARRWAFVGARMAALAPVHWHGEAADLALALRAARRVRTRVDPHVAPWLPPGVQDAAEAPLFPAVTPACASFSQWWARVQRSRGP